MPRCLLSIDGNNYDVTNLMNEEGLRNYLSELRLQAMRRQQEQQQPQQSDSSTRRRASSANFDWSIPLYPNLSDPCNRRLLQAVVMEEWKSMPLVKDPSQQPADQSDKYAEFYELQRQDMERMQQQHHHQQQLNDLSHAADYMTALPQRAQTAPLHSEAPPSFAHQTSTATSFGSSSAVRRSSGSSALLSSSPQTNPSAFTAAPRQSLPPVRRPHRHSTTAVPGDIDSSSSGLRPRVNYKSLYSRGRNLSGNSASGSLNGDSLECCEEDDTTSTTMMSSSRLNHHQDYDEPLESPVEDEEEESSASPTTMEIAPNVRVAVRSSQETYKAVQSGEYTVATCFACASAIVCVDDAAYVLCPDCQVVSPLGCHSTNDASKKDDPYGIGTGLKREWVNAWVGSI